MSRRVAAVRLAVLQVVNVMLAVGIGASVLLGGLSVVVAVQS